MKYLFCLLACGREDYTRRTLAAYAAFLNPAPSEVFVYDDGGQLDLAAVWPAAWADVPRALASHPTRIGRCAAHAKLWDFAASSPRDWVFTAEDDIVLLRPLNVRHLAELLDAEPRIAQVALVRCPWGAEIAYGGYIPQFPDRYTRRLTYSHPAWPGASQDWLRQNIMSALVENEWIESTVDWTSSPALLRAALTREVSWPAEPGCELELGPRIRAIRPDAVSAYWGWGEPWTAHVGMERVEGGHGY